MRLWVCKYLKFTLFYALQEFFSIKRLLSLNLILKENIFTYLYVSDFSVIMRNLKFRLQKFSYFNNIYFAYFAATKDISLV